LAAGRQARQRTDRALANCELTDWRDQRAGRYSGGMKRRLNFAIALLQEPRLLAEQHSCDHIRLSRELVGVKVHGTVRPGNREARPDPELAVTLAKESEPARNGHYLFNCFAFGGNNNALVIAHHSPAQGVSS
jgi:hypothetical protein